MFDGQKVARLESELKDLRDRYYKLLERVTIMEGEISPYRIGDDPRLIGGVWYGYPGLEDHRPKVTLRQAIDMLRDHLKLKFTKTDAVPERIELEKVKA